MKYLIPAILLAVYFEILGQYLLKKYFKSNLKVGFGIGFLSFIAFTYVTTSLISKANLHFAFIFMIYSFFIILSLILIIKDYKKIKYSFSIYHLAILVLVVIFIYYSLNTTLGPLHGLDTLHYLNLVTSNADWDYLNSKIILCGLPMDTALLRGYAYQTYYYFAAYIVFIFKTLFDFIPSTTYIWTFQILFYLTFFSLIINTFEKFNKKRYLLLVLSILLIGFYFGKLYFNSVFGFFGNSYRIIAFGYTCLFLFDYFKEQTIINRSMVSIGILSACAFSSSSLFISIILMFTVFVLFVNRDDKLIKWMSLLFVFPLINLLDVVVNNAVGSVIAVVVLLSLIFCFNKKIHYFIKKTKMNVWIVFVLIIFMVIMSYMITRNIFDFSAFFYSLSERADMTINYFVFNEYTPAIRYIYIFIYFISFIIVFIKNRKDNFVLITLIIFGIFLNPLCCTFFYKLDMVYHRTYDAIFNPFIYMYLINEALNTLNNRKIENIVLGATSVLSVININFLEPSYYNLEFIPAKNYDIVYKMDKNQLDIILKLREDIKNNNIDSPRIVTNDVLTQSAIPNATYFYGRNYLIDKSWTPEEKQIYSIFFYGDKLGEFKKPDNADYMNVENYIKEAKIDYLVLDKGLSFLNPSTNEWMPLMFKIDEFKYPFYENDEYVIYHFDRNN